MFCLVVVHSVPTLMIEFLVPADNLEVMVSPELLMVAASSPALRRAVRSSCVSIRGASGGMMPLVMRSWRSISSISSSFSNLDQTRRSLGFQEHFSSSSLASLVA